MRKYLALLAIAAAPAFSASRFRPAAAVSDYDNDLRPDIATAAENSSHAGRYSVQVHLTASSEAHSFELSAKTGGLRLYAQDVDGDHDVDLIISTIFGEHVGVWLNDGHGSFSQGVSADYPEWIWDERPDLRACASNTTTADCASPHDDFFAQPPTRAAPLAAPGRAIPVNSCASVPQSPAFGANSIRPPPSL